MKALLASALLLVLSGCNPKESIPARSQNPPGDQSGDINRQSRENWNANNAGQLLNQDKSRYQQPGATPSVKDRATGEQGAR